MIEAPRLRPGKKGEVDMPIFFCASLLPCECAIQAAVKICNLPKTEWTAAGVKRWKIRKSANITRAPRKKPASGDVIIGTTTFGQRPLFHFNTVQFPRAVASAAPHSQLIRA